MLFSRSPNAVVTQYLGGPPARFVAPLIEYAHAAFAAPRCPESVAAFLQHKLPPGRYFIYGAGSHGSAAATLLAQREDIDLAGFLDKEATHLAEVAGLPVYLPEHVRDEHAQILLLHTCRNRDMAASLKKMGVTPARVVDIYAHPEYTKIAVARSRSLPEAAKVVIIRAGRSHVVEDTQLARVFDPEHTVICSIARSDYQEPSSIFPYYDLGQSLEILEHVLATTQPEMVYLCTGWFNHFLAPAIASMAPQARLIHEVFDWNMVRPDGPLSSILGLSPQTHAYNLLGEYWSMEQVDLIISKRSGAHWQRLTQHFKVPYCAWFTGARPAKTQGETNVDETIGIVYGGLLPHPRFLDDLGTDYRFLPLFEALAASGDVQVRLYNSLHDSAEKDDLFAAYGAKYVGPRLHYSPNKPYDQFLDDIVDSDYGWLASVARSGEDPDQHCVMPNRVVGYLAAGLPLIVDPGWGYVAALVEEFEAGLVLQDFAPTAVLAALKSAPRQRHREGAARLADHLLNHNQTTLKHLKTLCL